MKCVVGLLFFAVCAMEMISAVPVRNGMVFYQSQPDYYYGSNAHRAFVMQYASQPLKAYRRNGQAAGVSAFASGKKIAAGTYLRNTEQLEDEDQGFNGQADHVVSDATAFENGPQDDVEQTEDEQPQNYPIRPVANDEPVEDAPEEEPVRGVVPTGNKKTPVVRDEEDDEEDDDAPRPSGPSKSRNRGSQGGSYFPVTFGSTNGGAIAIANSYSTGKGGTASSRATAYGSAAKPKRRIAQQ